MTPPFEKFVIHSNGPNEFIVRVASPSLIRNLDKVHELNTEKILQERCIFLEDAIDEKLNKERDN